MRAYNLSSFNNLYDNDAFNDFKIIIGESKGIDFNGSRKLRELWF